MAVSAGTCGVVAAAGQSEAFGELYDRHANANLQLLTSGGPRRWRRRGSHSLRLPRSLAQAAPSGHFRSRRRGAAVAVRRRHERDRNESRPPAALHIERCGPRAAAVLRPQASERAAEEASMRAVLEAVREVPRREQDVLGALRVRGAQLRAGRRGARDSGRTVRSRLARARSRLGELSREEGHEPGDEASSLSRARGWTVASKSVR